MEIILSVIFILGFIVYFKVQEERAISHSNTHRVDWGKVNDDRIMNDLSNSDVNRNIINGKYDAHVTTNKSRDGKILKEDILMEAGIENDIF